MEIDNEYCEKHCKGYRDTGGRCFADGRCDAYWEYQKQNRTMSKEELIGKMVTEVMEEFDFDRVHRVMVNLDWKWAIDDGEITIPSTYRIMKKAKGLLISAANHFGEGNYSCGSGGLMAHLDGTTLTLQFVLTEMTSYADDFINTED